MKKYFLSALLILFSGLNLAAQVQLSSSVFSNGAVRASSGNLTLQGSIGQAIVGPTQANSIIANGGFWPTAARTVACGDPVISLADSGEGSLREAIACAVTGDTIRFSIFGSIVLTSGPLEITQGIVIDPGNSSVIIDAQDNSRIFEINTTEEVVLRNLILQRGSTSEFGGAIFGTGSLTAVNCNFNNNQAENGGAITMGEGDLNLINCSIGFNRANSETGAVLFFNGNVNIVNTIFNQNSSGVAGAAVTLANVPTARVINSTFYGNVTSTTAGAIWAANVNLELYNSLFQDNSATASSDVFTDFNSGSTITARNVIMGSANGSGLTPGINNVVELDALLSNPNSFDFSLQPFSPAHGNADPSLLPIDTYDADNDGDTTDPIDFDLLGNPRGSTGGCNFDIGAVETAQGSLTVLNNNDSGVGSLRAHIECANSNPNINQISFAIPGNGPHTIDLLSNLPSISTPNLTIDGTSQEGFEFGSPTVIIDGNGIASDILFVGADNVSVLGLGLRNAAPNNGRCFGAADSEFLTFSGNTVFTNQGQDQIAFFNLQNSSIFNNQIGIDLDGTPTSLLRPILFFTGSSGNTIEGNTLAGPDFSVLLYLADGSNDNNVQFNNIGTNTDRSQSFGGGAGLLFDASNDNLAFRNTIANNRAGIENINGATNNILSENNFLCNTEDGIRGDAGTQNDVAPPIITRAVPGLLIGIANPNAVVEIYEQDNTACPNGPCQGVFVGFTNSDINGDWSFTDVSFPEGTVVTALNSDGLATSPFAICATIACDLTAEVVTPVQINCNNPQIALEASSNGTNVTFAWTGPNNFISTEQNPIVTEAGVYNLTVTDLAGCVQTAAVIVNGDFVEPNISLVGAMLDCNNPTTFLSGSSSTPDATFAWSGPNGFSADIPDPEISEPGDYTFTVTGPNGCTSSGNLTVVRDETVAPTAGFDFTIDDNLGVVVEGTAGPNDSYFYDFGNGQTSTDQNSSTTYLSPGLKTITQIVSNQCGADTIEVQVDLPAPANAVRFCFPEKSEGANGELIDIPVKVTDFNNVASLQLSVKVGDPAIAQIVSVGDFALPDLDENDFNVINDTTVSMAWFFGNSASLPDSSVIFTVQVLLTGTDAVCTPIFMSDTPVFIEVGVLNPNTNSIDSAPYEVVAGEVCILPFADISGRIFRETGNGLKEVEVACTDQMPVITGPDGLYEFLELQTGLDYFINPSRNTNPVEGVTAIDLALIQRHILTLQFLDSPYKIIAADVDSSLSVGAIDLANIQRLILGRTDVFPNNQRSWSFVDASFQFTNPNDPFVDAIPVGRLVTDLRTDVTDVDFVGMKLGDVNGSAQGRQLSTPLELLIVETEVDNERTVEFRVKDGQAIAAYQFDIHFDPGKMQFLDIVPGNLPGINANSFAFHKIDEGIIPTLWYDPSGNPAGFELEKGQVLFSLKFRGAQQLPTLDQRVWTREATMPAVAYTGSGFEMPIASFYPSAEIKQPLVLPTKIQVEDLRPNPFSDQTQLRFYLPKADNVDIQVTDALGRTVKRIQQQFGVGNHQIELQGTDLGSSGWYIVHLRTGDFVKSQRMIYQRQ